MAHAVQATTHYQTYPERRPGADLPPKKACNLDPMAPRSLSVDDVAAELARAETAGLRTEPAALRSYPVLGEALVGACFVDECRVEFVRFLDC